MQPDWPVFPPDRLAYHKHAVVQFYMLVENRQGEKKHNPNKMRFPFYHMVYVKSVCRIFFKFETSYLIERKTLCLTTLRSRKRSPNTMWNMWGDWFCKIFCPMNLIWVPNIKLCCTPHMPFGQTWNNKMLQDMDEGTFYSGYFCSVIINGGDQVALGLLHSITKKYQTGKIFYSWLMPISESRRRILCTYGQSQKVLSSVPALLSRLYKGFCMILAQGLRYQAHDTKQADSCWREIIIDTCFRTSPS